MRKLDLVLDPILDFHLKSVLDSEVGFGASLKESDPMKWLRDVATLSINPGRQTGKSFYVARTADGHENDIVICSDKYSYELMIKRRELLYPVPRLIRTYLMKNDLGGIDGVIRDVWIDSDGNLDKSLLDKLYKSLAGRCRRFIIIG